MSRYFEIVSRSIDGAGAADRAAREALYERLRRELDRLLGDDDPHARRAHRAELEAAIAEVERARAGPPPAAASGTRTIAAAPPVRVASAATDARPGASGGFAEPRLDGGTRPRAAGPAPASAPIVAADPSRDRDAPFEDPAAPDDAVPVLFAEERGPGSRVRFLLAVAAATVIAVLVGVALVVTPLHFAETAPDSLIAERLVHRRAATLFLGGAEGRFAQDEGVTAEHRFIPFTRGAVRLSAQGERAARIVLSPSVRPALAGRTLRVIAVARAAERRPSPEMAMAVYVDGEADAARWERVPLSEAFEAHALTHTFDGRVTMDPPVIAIRPDPAGEGRAVEVSEVSLFLGE